MVVISIVSLINFNYTGSDRFIVSIDRHDQSCSSINSEIESDINKKYEFFKKGDIDIIKLEKYLKDEYPAIENVSVYRKVKDDVYIDIKNATPTMRVFERDSSYYVDKSGKKMSLYSNCVKAVPVIFGSVNKSNIDEVNKLIAVIKNDSVLKYYINSIRINEKGVFTLYPCVGKYVIRLGHLNDLDEKFFKLNTLYRYLLKDLEENKYISIDLRFDHQVVCTKRI
ncbi:cell division protein FtsQ [Ichthyobacterium seriolicida]|uniref:Cell division protein FtsQ n=2 Tax=Ichthyobacterium seriolicida TaxID=242600 RepID=A0A1J1EBE1_9FLAO|nr:cell division protein FtsQ [Ichthyobacterium seriolicida]